ncbi:hypothetical protein Rsub_11469 [Raphidocelis subcapitata]|uniref:Aminotransferase class I/classII large domain-containing protein n=1 Tax=Raphidocelis subcapitata TaxID=307507 RepID=A0A2V0PNX6_9CHLO|nr:hypothetical protein Rsub_11469 [Raphidocelis subcapitata]|eukprot:GBF98865.1 hypothetical protein Rsub_11469 [Raphidocelis subcapitata]
MIESALRERMPGRAAGHAHGADDAAAPSDQAAPAPISPRVPFAPPKRPAAAAPAAAAAAPAAPAEPTAPAEPAARLLAPATAQQGAARRQDLAPAGDEEAAGEEEEAARPARYRALAPDMINPNILKTQVVGNPHALGARPKTFTREVLALCAAPWLIDDDPSAHFAPDARARAARLLGSFPGGVGAYSDSRGSAVVRGEVAGFVGARDGHAADPEAVFLTDGASPGVRMLLSALIRSPSDAILVPVPQYPLYSAAIQLLDGAMVPYPLDESHDWGLSTAALEGAVKAARGAGLTPRGLVIINPDEGLVLLADEVYQELAYRGDRPFLAARKVVLDAGPPLSTGLEVVSFHTASKGTSGECGLRGGYFELLNFHPATVDQLYKLASINLCPNSAGQIAVSCMVNPPAPGDPSFPKWDAERRDEFESLVRRAAMVAEGFGHLPGVRCNKTEGAMYCFPRLSLPRKAVAAARAAGRAPDAFYCLRLLEASGIVTVPGCGFGQEEGTFHLRTTILPREADMAAFVAKFEAFHTAFMEEFA